MHESRLLALLASVAVMGAATAHAQAPDAGQPPAPDAPPAPAPEEPAPEPPAEAEPPPEPEEPTPEPEPPVETEPPAEAPPVSPGAEPRSPTAIEPEPQPVQPVQPVQPEPAPQPAPESGPYTEPGATQAQSQPQPAPRPVPTRQRDPYGDQSQWDDEKATKKEGKDKRQHDWFWIEPFFGYSYVNLLQFRNDNLLPRSERTEASGFSGGLGLGFKVWWISLGFRGVASRYPDFYIGSVMFDAALRIPLGPVEPYIRAGLGYTWLGSPNFNQPGDSQIDIYGLMTEAGAGLDFYVTDVVAIGFGVDAVFLNLTRQETIAEGLPGPDGTTVELGEDGDAVGFQLRAQGHIGFHF